MNRLDVYDEQTSALKAYFSDLGLLHNVQGTGSINDIQKRICSVLDSGGVGDRS
jgi:adenylate kinase family enzyme